MDILVVAVNVLAYSMLQNLSWWKFPYYRKLTLHEIKVMKILRIRVNFL